MIFCLSHFLAFIVVVVTAAVDVVAVFATVAVVLPDCCRKG